MDQMYVYGRSTINMCIYSYHKRYTWGLQILHNINYSQQLLTFIAYNLRSDHNNEVV